MSKKWCAVQLDRDFETGEYGLGIYYYELGKARKIIEGVSYHENVLVVKSGDYEFKITEEPDINFFRNGVYKNWQEWNSRYGYRYEDDNVDFIPWCLKSLKALAIELNLIDNTDNESLYNKY